jgi:hypothetical protein
MVFCCFELILIKISAAKIVHPAIPRARPGRLLYEMAGVLYEMAGWEEIHNVKCTMGNVQIPMIFNLKFPRFSICNAVT